MSEANVIVLNGTSSAGKTTLAKAIQYVAETPYQILSFDQFRDGLPDRFRGLNSPDDTTGAQGINVVAERLNGEIKTYIRFGDHLQQVMHAMHQSVLAFIESDQNVILDHFVNNAITANNLMMVLANVNRILVQVTCEPDELLHREQSRPGRFPGTAETQRALMSDCLDYDLSVDSTHTDPISLANQVLEYIANTNLKPNS